MSQSCSYISGEVPRIIPIPTMSWSTGFDESILLPDNRALVTLRDAANHVMALPKREAEQPQWQLAVECLMAAAEKRGIVMMARIAVGKALTFGQPVEQGASRKAAKKYRILT